jgi:energy-coupling factor transport system ATP-binding protein
MLLGFFCKGGACSVKPMIDARNLVHEYSRRDEEGNITQINRALDGISLQVQAGDFIAILGANGSGKSTFAKHLDALLLPTEGTLYVDGRDTTLPEEELSIRQAAGIVFQNPDNQIVASVVEEDVGFGPENLGIPSTKIWKRVEESLRSVGMWEYRKSSPNRLSGGQKQRVAIAGIMAMHPKCIILDEPTAMLDPEGRKAVIEAIHQINHEGNITIILITHYMEEVIHADHVFVMDAGRIVMQGTPREIFAQADEVKKYHLTIPVATQLALKLREMGVNIPDYILDAEELVQQVEKIYQSRGTAGHQR